MAAGVGGGIQASPLSTRRAGDAAAEAGKADPDVVRLLETNTWKFFTAFVTAWTGLRSVVTVSPTESFLNSAAADLALTIVLMILEQLMAPIRPMEVEVSIMARSSCGKLL